MSSVDDLVLDEVRAQPDDFVLVKGTKFWTKKYILDNWDKDPEMWAYIVETLMIEAAHLEARNA